MAHHCQIAERDFSKRTLKALTLRGIRILGVQTIPGERPMPMANGTRGYRVDDGGTGRVLDHARVLSEAGR